MERVNGHFDDPALRAAIHRVWGAETAPQGLRDRLHDALTHELVFQLKPMTGWQRWQSRLYGMAAAAVLLIGVGLLAFEARTVIEARPQQVAIVSMPDSMASAMNLAHDRWLSSERGHMFSGDTALNVIRYRLSHDLGIAVPATSIDGWTLKKAGYSRVGGAQVAHLLYARGEQSVSIFAIPTRALSASLEGDASIDIVRGRPVLGQVVGDALYCVVGSGPRISLQDAVAVRNQMLADVASR